MQGSVQKFSSEEVTYLPILFPLLRNVEFQAKTEPCLRGRLGRESSPAVHAAAHAPCTPQTSFSQSSKVMLLMTWGRWLTFLFKTTSRSERPYS